MTDRMKDVCDLDGSALLTMYQERRYDELSEGLLTVLEHFRQRSYLTLDRTTQGAIDRFVKLFLFLFTQSDYQISDAHALRFLVMNPIISEVVATSCFQTTDAYLEVLKNQSANFIKVLTLFSARNTVALDRKAFVNANPWLASAWYSLFMSTYRTGLVRAEIVTRLVEHLSFHDSRLTALPDSSDIFFGSTYVGGDVDRAAKAAINAALSRQFSETAIDNRPKRRHLAVISGTWFPQHPVHRNYFAYLQALRDYHLTLVWLGPPSLEMDTSLFQDVRHVRLVDGALHLEEIARNDFEVAYFPDIGLTAESVILANLRLAPIQIASLGHSASTWGAKIDYFISGAAVEIADQPEQNYSERLVLLPGCGVIHNRPAYLPKFPGPAAGEFIINCPWASPKINARFCGALQEIVRRTPRPVKLRLFSGFGLTAVNGFICFERELQKLFGRGIVEIVPFRSYADYMAQIEEGQFGLDSYHFGGCNTVVDSLWLAKPMVTWEGDKWYNRIGSQLLRMAGLPELVATSEEQYIVLALRLIENDEWRDQLGRRLRAADLDQSLFSTADARYFRDAIELLVAEHARLQSSGARSPIRIGSS
jgi:predicted O-linked N-acetylglucosamine transferase (SPINDLY family)